MRWNNAIRRAIPFCIFIVACTAAAAEQPETLVERLLAEPEILRDSGVVRRLAKADPELYRPLMRELAADSSRPWDLRARAVTMLDVDSEPAAVKAFSADFVVLEVAALPDGAEAFNILAAWALRRRDSGGAIGRLILPAAGGGDHHQVLGRLAGRPLSEYLRFLLDEGHALRPVSIEALAETDDQLTRRLLCWYVGDRRLRGMEGFLVAQIASPRTSSYRSQVDRFLVAALTAGIGELIRQAAPTPRWMEDDVTPKGLALESLGVLLPAGREIPEPEWTTRLLAAAAANAGGKDRGQWQLAIDVLDFLHQRGVPLQEGGEEAVSALLRQVLRKRGPLEPFIAAARLRQSAGVAWPELDDDEKEKVWAVAMTTLNRDFIAAVIAMLPDEQRLQALRAHLLGQQEQAGRGSLHVVRCWGADIEGPGDWAGVVAELGLIEAVGGVEQVLETSWTDEAAAALAELGAAGAPALDRFLRSDRARYLDSEVKLKAIRACLQHLPEKRWSSLVPVLRADRYLAEALDRVVGE